MISQIAVKHPKGVIPLQQLAFDGRTRLDDLEGTAIDRVRYYSQFAPHGYLIMAFSGGKDSGAAEHLVKKSGVPYQARYNPTGVDPPELIYHIRRHYPEVVFEPYQYTMWSLIKKKRFPPTRRRRYCCEFLKERGNRGMAVVTGVRLAESTGRALNGGVVKIQHKNKDKRVFAYDPEQGAHLMKTCPIGGKILVNPICDWTDDDVWAYTRREGIPYCSLYDEGFDRLGCIGCPCGSRDQRERQFARWPKFKAAYIKTFDEMLRLHPERLSNWKTGQDVFDWWLSDAAAVSDDEGLFETP